MKFIALGAAGCLILVSGSYWMGHSAGQDKTQSKWNQDKAAQAQAVAAQEARHRTIERKQGEAITALWTSLIAAQEASKNELQAVIADRDAGVIRLRERFRGCESELSATTGAASGDNGGSQSGLSEADQRFFVRIGAECDAVVNRLTAAQEYIRAVLR